MNKNRVVLVTGVVDGIIGQAGAAVIAYEPKLDPDYMAEAYWQLANEHRTTWAFELDLRSDGENFSSKPFLR